MCGILFKEALARHKEQLEDDLDEEGGDDRPQSVQATYSYETLNPGMLAHKTAVVIYIFDGLLRVPSCKYIRA